MKYCDIQAGTFYNKCTWKKKPNGNFAYPFLLSKEKEHLTRDHKNSR